MCAAPLYERGRSAGERDGRRCTNDAVSTTHGECAAVGPEDAVAKRNSYRRIVCCAERLPVSEYVQVGCNWDNIFWNNFIIGINFIRHQYVALIDLDEFLIPRHNNTLKELMQYVYINSRILILYCVFNLFYLWSTRWFSTRIYSRNTGAYSFQNAFFYLQFADDVLMYERDPQLNNALRAAMVTQRKTRR